MKIRITVVPGASSEEVIPLPDGSFKVRVTARAKDGEANDALIAALARHFRVPRRTVEIRSGHASRRKSVEIV